MKKNKNNDNFEQNLLKTSVKTRKSVKTSTRLKTKFKYQKSKKIYDLMESKLNLEREYT